jgi:hypothetical protein
MGSIDIVTLDFNSRKKKKMIALDFNQGKKKKN